ncbi:DUF6678 family protein [Tenacibaculum maritimum]|uniref:DUF6678 family protein n=1 Tax=Tenacibaculum maritimum TaxID=107401 RepID=UPI0012E5A515|nr:DUF6678 family protein [Tenacibaculum maritimum]CAA0248823.1 conserved hypothetical protein [Tenacibaculum maritimum]
MNRSKAIIEEIKDLYRNIDASQLSEAAAYRYLTQHDPDIVQYKEKIVKIVQERGLGSYMNTTKWLKLQKAMAKLPFEPAYLEKLITDKEFRYANVVTKNNTSLGNWAPYYMEGMPLFFAIEYLVIIPRYVSYVGRLVKGKTKDISKEIEEVMKINNIPFEKDAQDNFVVFGYK